MALDGRSLRGLFLDAGYISLFRSIERAVKLNLQEPPPTLLRTLGDLLKTARPTRIREMFVRALLDGDDAAKAELASMGSWAVFQESFRHDMAESQILWTQQFIDIERASKDADLHLSEKRYDSAADALSSDPQLRIYLTDRALITLRSATTDGQATMARAAGALEVLLASAARNDVVSRADRKSDESFEWMLSPGPSGACQLGRAWARRVVSELGPGTLEGLLELAQDPSKPHKSFVDHATLKRWHSGKTFPSVNKASSLLKVVLTNRKARTDPSTDIDLQMERFGCALGSAIRIHKCLELLGLIDGKLRDAGHDARLVHLLGHESPSDWARMRYSSWLDHWQSILP